MIKIQHKQSGEIRDIGRQTWENGPEYQTLRNLWQILDEGDPVMVIWIEETGDHRELGLFDRDHAINMIKMNSKQCYYKEADRRSDESKLIDKILQDAQQNYITPVRDTPDEYEQALHQAKRIGLVKKISKDSYDLTAEGQRAYDLGGVDNWRKAKESESQTLRSINVSGGNAIIGNNNTGVSQGRDFLNSESPIKKNEPQQAQPTVNPIKKSDHTIWDKIKYISVIVGGLSAIILGMAKVFGWW